MKLYAMADPHHRKEEKKVVMEMKKRTFLKGNRREVHIFSSGFTAESDELKTNVSDTQGLTVVQPPFIHQSVK